MRTLPNNPKKKTGLAKTTSLMKRASGQVSVFSGMLSARQIEKSCLIPWALDRRTVIKLMRLPKHDPMHLRNVQITQGKRTLFFAKRSWIDAYVRKLSGGNG